MALLNGMPKRVGSKIILTCSIAGMVTLTGCSPVWLDRGSKVFDEKVNGNLTDLMKPDVNRDQKLLTDPELVYSPFDDSPREVYSEEGWGDHNYPDSPNSGSAFADPTPPSYDNPHAGSSEANKKETPSYTPSTNWNQNIDPEKFSPFQQNTVNQKTYREYMKRATTDIERFIADKPNIYFTFFSRGYDYTPITPSVQGEEEDKSKTKYEARLSVPPVTKIEGSNNKGTLGITGDTLSNYLVDWLGNLPVNEALHNTTKAKVNMVSKVDNTVTMRVVEDDSTVDTVTGTDVESNIESNIYTMWKRNERDCNLYGQFRALVSNNGWGGIPNVELEYYKSATDRRKVTINNTLDPNTIKGFNSMDLIRAATVNFNQFETRSFNGINRWGSECYADSRSRCYAYVDGYTTSFMFLCTKDGASLKSEFDSEEEYNNFITLLDNVKCVTDTEGVFNVLNIDPDSGEREHCFIPSNSDVRGKN